MAVFKKKKKNTRETTNKIHAWQKNHRVSFNEVFFTFFFLKTLYVTSQVIVPEAAASSWPKNNLEHSSSSFKFTCILINSMNHQRWKSRKVYVCIKVTLVTSSSLAYWSVSLQFKYRSSMWYLCTTGKWNLKSLRIVKHKSSNIHINLS